LYFRDHECEVTKEYERRPKPFEDESLPVSKEETQKKESEEERQAQGQREPEKERQAQGQKEPQEKRQAQKTEKGQG
jgi:hypothetical protein